MCQTSFALRAKFLRYKPESELILLNDLFDFVEKEGFLRSEMKFYSVLDFLLIFRLLHTLVQTKTLYFVLFWIAVFLGNPAEAWARNDMICESKSHEYGIEVDTLFLPTMRLKGCWTHWKVALKARLFEQSGSFESELSFSTFAREDDKDQKICTLRSYIFQTYYPNGDQTNPYPGNWKTTENASDLRRYVEVKIYASSDKQTWTKLVINIRNGKRDQVNLDTITCLPTAEYTQIE